MSKRKREAHLKSSSTLNINREKVFILLFVIVSLLSGWIGLLVDTVIPEQMDEQTLGMGIWLVLPFLCGIIIRIFRRDWKDFGVKPGFRHNVRWYALAALFFPAVTLVFTLIAWMLGYVNFSSFSSGSILPVFTSLLIGLIMKNIFEDFAWQGYLTPKLVSIKTNDFFIYLIVGLVWAFWHAPYYLYFLPDTFYNAPIDRILDALVRSPIIITVWAVIFVEITRITGSVWPAVLMHTSEDLIPNFLIFDERIIEFNGIGNELLNPLTGVIPLITYLTFGLWLRKIRMDKDNHFT